MLVVHEIGEVRVASLFYWETSDCVKEDRLYTRNIPIINLSTKYHSYPVIKDYVAKCLRKQRLREGY